MTEPAAAPRRERERQLPDDRPTEPIPVTPGEPDPTQTPEGEPETPNAPPSREPEELADSGDYPQPGVPRGDTGP